MVGTTLVQSIFIAFLMLPLQGFCRAARPISPKDFRILSLNLHAYHPMGEPNRLFQDRAGKTRDANTDIFFFTPQELDRGNRLRLDTLAKAVRDLEPDLILFQEVTAGSPGKTKCTDFYAPFVRDALPENTVARLQSRMKALGQNYLSHLACRGNVGWVTSSRTFKNEQILRIRPNGSTEVAIPFDANPYPDGIVIEGLGIMSKSQLQIKDHQNWSVEYGELPDRFFVQALSFSLQSKTSTRNEPTFVIANIHGGHKVSHFEQAVALRKKIDEYVTRAPWKNNFGGVFIVGDFNAALYRPREKNGYIESTPWEVAVEGQFDLRIQNPNFDPASLAKRLEELNMDQNYKPWATIKNPAEAKRRIQKSVTDFVAWQRAAVKEKLPTILKDAVAEAQKLGLCKPMSPWNITCEREKNIDHIFFSPNLKLKTAFIAFSDAGWATTRSLSDHPGIQAHFDLTPQKKGSF